MTSSTFQQLPVSVTISLWRGIRGMLGWLVVSFLKNPLQNMAIILLATALSISFLNALFWQTGVHPAPMFGLKQPQAFAADNEDITLRNSAVPHPRELSTSRISRQEDMVLPLNQPIPKPVSTPVQVDFDKVTNEILAQAQTALAEMGLFSGKVDGFYGPLTADAIRAFERQQGLVARGAMSPEIIRKIINFKAEQSGIAVPVSSASESAVSQPLLRTSPAQPDNTRPHTDVKEQDVADPLISIASSVNQSSTNALASGVAVQPSDSPLQNDKQLVEKIQRGLSSLGFYYSPIDGVLNETTARAIREFENFKGFESTGLISPQLLIWLQEAGAIT